MLKANLYHKPKQQSKKQRSQQAKQLRYRKNSPSPIYKQIIINKQNIHPNHHNLNINNNTNNANYYNNNNNHNNVNYMNNNLNNLNSNPINANINNKNQNVYNYNNLHNIPISLDTHECRQTYYRLKQQNLNNKLANINTNTNTNINNYMNINKQTIQSPTMSRSSFFNTNKIPRQIQIKINNRSLQKCQLHPTTTIHNNNNNNNNNKNGYPQFVITKQNIGDILACQDCVGQYHNKISIDRIANTFISPGINIQQYFNILQQKLDKIETMKFNIEAYAKQFRQMSAIQAQKHRKYYNNILEVIETSMKESESLIAKYVNQGQAILTEKKQNIQNQYKFIKEQLKKLLNFQDKQIKFPLSPYQKQTKFKIQAALSNLQSQINLPIISLFTQVSDLQQNFKKVFNTNFSLVLLTKKQLEQQQKQKQKQLKKTQRPTIPQSAEQSYKRTVSRFGDQDDLFCDQQLGESKTNKTHQFSFQKSNQESLIATRSNNDCILQLVEEEDVISPVFKAI